MIATYGNTIIMKTSRNKNSDVFPGQGSASSGSLETYTYDSFGNEIETCGRPALLNRYRYTGREFDYFGASYETTLYSVGLGHYHNRARTYDHTLGTFLQTDPVWSPNLYVYTGNNPVIMVDSYGKEPTVGQLPEEEKKEVIRNIIKQNLTDHEIIDRCAIHSPHKTINDFFQQRYNTIFGYTDMDWAFTLARWSEMTKIPPFMLYSPGKTVWSLSDDFPKHFFTFYNKEEVNAILFATALLSPYTDFEDLFPDSYKNSDKNTKNITELGEK